MRISLIYTFAGGILLGIVNILQTNSVFGDSAFTILIPLAALAFVLFLGIRAMRQTNAGFLDFKEGFFTGMNISIGSGIMAAIILAFYYMDFAPERFQYILEQMQLKGIEDESVQQKLLLSMAFRTFFGTTMPGLIFTLGLSALLRKSRKTAA